MIFDTIKSAFLIAFLIVLILALSIPTAILLIVLPDEETP